MYSDRKQLERDALAQIRKNAVNPYARLHSIAEDAKYVQEVHNHFKSYPIIGMTACPWISEMLVNLMASQSIIANLRCGAWYTSRVRAVTFES